MERIASFSVDHTKLLPGLYLSRRDENIVTLDLRFRRPNIDPLLTNSELHSLEHLVATLLRNSSHGDAIVYFGPMGCQTGFYFLFNENRMSCAEAIALLQEVSSASAVYEGEMPGCHPAECGNYRSLDMEACKNICAYYAGVIKDWTVERLDYDA